MLTSWRSAVRVSYTPVDISLNHLRQCTAEVLACAVTDLFPDTLLGEGVITPTGFYYDFSFRCEINADYLPQIEERMRALIMDNLPIRALSMMRQNAIEFFRDRRQLLKVQFLSQSQETVVDLIQFGQFYDLCSEPCLETTRPLLAFKLLKVFSLNNPDKLTRITGTVWPDKESLKKFIKNSKEAENCNHIQLGEKLRIFLSCHEHDEEYWFWTAKGIQIQENLFQWWEKEHRDLGFQIVSSPKLLPTSLFKKAGKENDAGQAPGFSLGDTEYAMAPLALSHAILFSTQRRLLSDLPLRYAECGTVFSAVSSGQLYGMFNTRECRIDRAHLFCPEEIVVDQLISSLRFIKKMIKMFGFEAKCYLCLSSPYKKKEQIRWEQGIAWITKAAEAVNEKFRVEQVADLPGPLLEFRLQDAAGNEWSGPSVGIEIRLPKYLNLKYLDEVECQPVMIVQSLLGSFERFIGLLLECTTGNLPKWLIP